jgi:hypothetical protein
MNILTRTEDPYNIALTSSVDNSFTHVTYSVAEWFSSFNSIAVELHLSGLNGTLSNPDTQKIWNNWIFL